MKLVLSSSSDSADIDLRQCFWLVFRLGLLLGQAIAIFTFSFMAKQLYEMIEAVDMETFLKWKP